MKVDKNTITITSFAEARAVAYAPIDSDCRMGWLPGFYAAGIAGIPEHRRDDCNISFLNDTIGDYFQVLIDNQHNHKLASINMTTGTEKDSSWWGYGADCISRYDWDDSRPYEYLRVIRYILEQGYDSFDIEFYDDYDNITEMCKITKKGKAVSFFIERTVDPNAYDAVYNWVQEKERERRQLITATSADAFIES